MAEARADSLEVPGATLYFEVRGSGPLLVLHGVPMTHAAFAPLAEALADEYTVVTYDPRGFSASAVDDPQADCTPEQVADDLHHLLAALTSEAAFMFGSSGGGVAGLALAARHPDQVRTVVTHEPPAIQVLPDPVRQHEQARVADVFETYRRDGQAAAWAKFFALNGFDPPTAGPGRAPSGSREWADGERMMAHWILPCTGYRPDLDALRAGATRVVVGVGKTSSRQLAGRTAIALAEQLGSPAVEFPGDHAGFISQTEAFAASLRRVLAAS